MTEKNTTKFSNTAIFFMTMITDIGVSLMFISPTILFWLLTLGINHWNAMAVVFFIVFVLLFNYARKTTVKEIEKVVEKIGKK